MDNEKTVLRMASFIRENGDRFKTLLILEKGTHDTRFNLIRNIEESYNSLEEYLTDQVNLFKPKSITVTTKKYNGNSGGRDPQRETFYFSNENMATQAPAIQPTLSGLAQENPYVFQLHLITEELKRETEEKQEYKAKAKKYKKSYQSTKLVLDTIEERHALEAAKAQYENDNSISGVVKELAPTLQGFLSGIAGNNKEPEEVNSLDGVTDPLLAGIIEMVRTLESQDVKNYFEIFVRIANCSEAQKVAVMEGLRKVTPQATESINQQINA